MHKAKRFFVSLVVAGILLFPALAAAKKLNVVTATTDMPEGYLVNPPDQRSNTQRIFVPRTALESLTVLAVIGAARRQRRPQDQRQVPMFEE